MSVDIIRQFVHFLDDQQAEYLAAVQENLADDALHENWMKGLVENGTASEKTTRVQQRRLADEGKAERRHAEAKVAVGAVPPHLRDEWLGRLARMLRTHLQLLANCAAVAARESHVSHDLMQAYRELRGEALRELNALSTAGSPLGAVPLEQVDAAGAEASSPTDQSVRADPRGARPMAFQDGGPVFPPFLALDMAAGDRVASAERRCAAADQAARLFRRRWDRVAEWLGRALAHWGDDAQLVRDLRALGKLLASALNDAPGQLAECDWQASYWPHARRILLAACRQEGGETAHAHRSRIGALLSQMRSGGPVAEEAIRDLCREWVATVMKERQAEVSRQAEDATEEWLRAKGEADGLVLRGKGRKNATGSDGNPLAVMISGVRSAPSALGQDVPGARPETGESSTNPDIPPEDGLVRAERAALHLAYMAETLGCMLYHDADWQQVVGAPPGDVERDVSLLLQQCIKECQPFLDQLRSAFGRQAVQGWGRQAASAVEALMDFACWVLEQWAARRGETVGREIGAPPWESLGAPVLGQFAGPVRQEFVAVRRLRTAQLRPASGANTASTRATDDAPNGPLAQSAAAPAKVADSLPAVHEREVPRCMFHADNSFANLVAWGWQIAADVQARRNARPRRDPTQAEYAEWELGFRRIGAECRVLTRRLGWDAGKAAKLVEDATRLIIGLVRRGSDDPYPDDPEMRFIWAFDRFTAALMPIQELAFEYEAEQRLAPTPAAPAARPSEAAPSEAVPPAAVVGPAIAADDDAEVPAAGNDGPADGRPLVVEDFLGVMTAGYRPGAELGRIVSELNNPTSDAPAAPDELEEVPSPFDMARRPWLPILKNSISQIPELAAGLTEEKLRLWLYRQCNVPPTQDLHAAQLAPLLERALARPGPPATTAAKPQDERQQPAAAELTVARAEQTDAASRAIALMLTWKREQRRYTVDDLAKAAGTSRATLYRDNRFVAARKAAKALGNMPPSGSKDAEGGLEARAPDAEDEDARGR